MPIEERPVLDPIDGNTFTLTSAKQTVIGEPQIVFAGAEDTLSDLARTYGLGYDDIVAANPDTNPWLPGEGTPMAIGAVDRRRCVPPKGATSMLPATLTK